MRLRDELAGLGHHGGLVLAAQVDGVAQADDVHTRFAHGEDGVQIVELGRVGVVLRSLHQVGLGVHLHEVVDLGIIGGILRDETALTSKDAAHALTADLEEMLGLGVGQIDSLAVEVLVQMLDLLVACEEHESTGSTRGLQVIVDVLLAGLGHDVCGNTNLITGDFRHVDPPFRMRYKAPRPKHRRFVRRRTEDILAKGRPARRTRRQAICGAREISPGTARTIPSY